MKDFVICQICGKRLKQLATGHMKVHKLSISEYKDMFPNAETTSELTRYKSSESKKLHHKLHPQTEETKKQISETMKKVYSNTNFSLNKINKNQKGKNNNFYGKIHTSKTRKKLSVKSTKWLKEAYSNGNKISPWSYLGQAKGMSKPESVVYQKLRELGFIYNYPVPFSKGRYLIDFAHVKFKIAIELDSKLHKRTMERDNRKDKYLKSKGWQIYRFPFTNRCDLKSLAEKINQFCIRLLYRKSCERNINENKTNNKDGAE